MILQKQLKKMNTEDQYKKILKNIRVQANGEIAENVQKTSKKLLTYGCNDLVIKNIANNFERNHQLAQMLWKENIREAKLIAILLEETDKLTEKQADELIHQTTDIHIINWLCLHLFSKLPFALEKCKEWKNNSSEFVKSAAYILLSRLAMKDNKISDNEFINFLPYLKNDLFSENKNISNAVSQALRRMVRRNFILCLRIENIIEKINPQENKNLLFLLEEIKMEIDFMDDTLSNIFIK